MKCFVQNPHRLLFQHFIHSHSFSMFGIFWFVCSTFGSDISWGWQTVSKNSFALFAILSLGPTSSQIIFYPVVCIAKKITRRNGITPHTNITFLFSSVDDKFEKKCFDLNQAKFLSVTDEWRVMCFILLGLLILVFSFAWRLAFLSLTFSYNLISGTEKMNGSEN